MAGVPRTTNPSAVPNFRSRISGGAGNGSGSEFTPSTEVGIYLSDGDAELNLIGTPPDGIWLQPKGFTWPVPEIENVYAQSDTSEFRSRIRTRPLNPDGREIKLFVGANTETDFWNYLDTLQELVASVHRKKGTLRVVPPRNGQEVTWDIESVRVKDIPDDGVELKQLLVEVTLEYEVRPYGKLDEIDLAVNQSCSSPSSWFAFSNVPGHVNALGKLIVREAATQAINHLEVGVQEDFDPDNPEPLTLGVDSMTLGFQGTRTTITGGYFTDGVRATLTTEPVTVCSTGRQPHKGRWRVRSRMKISAVDVWARLSWRVGDGPFTAEPWVKVSGAASFYDMELAILNIPEVPSGEHSWEGYIQAYASVIGTTIDIDTISPFPCDVYSRARTSSANTSSTVGVADTFVQAAGALNTKSPGYPTSLAYAIAGDSTDFVVGTDYYGDPALVRTATSDSSTVGCFELLPIPHTVVDASLDMGFQASTGSYSPQSQQAIALRYVDPSNFLLAVFQMTTVGAAGYDNTMAVGFVKVVGGVWTTIASAATTSPFYAAIGNASETIRATVTANGIATLWQNGVEMCSATDSALATGGTLAFGSKLGVYDEYTSATAATRYMANLDVTLPAQPAPVCYSSRTFELHHDAAIRDSSDGTFMGGVPQFDGGYLRLPPAGPGNRTSRIVIKRRRFDVDAGLPDSGLTDAFTADLAATGRVTALSKQV